jgi:membrane complex biogenesis BtpA family protein
MLKETFGSHKPIIGMIHMHALPGSPLYDARAGISAIIDAAAADIERLQKGGVDAVMFGNENDRPYLLKATPESLAAMAAVIGALRSTIKIPFGADYLWDPVATVALCAATQARFGREIMTGVFESDMGTWEPDCAGALRLRHNLGRDDLKLMFNVNAEFASSVGTRSVAQRAKSAAFSSLADVILVSGPMTGQAASTSDLRSAKEAVGDTPVFANTGVNIDTVKEILSIGDGCIVGTHFKVGGKTFNAVDGDRVKRFMDLVGKSR